MITARGRRRAMVTTVSDISYTPEAIVLREVTYYRSLLLLKISTKAVSDLVRKPIR
jgi:hypothetical protein